MKNIIKDYEEVASKPLGSAQSLPFEVYHDAEIYKKESELIFLKEWIFVCTEREIPDAGDYFSLSIANESIIVTRGSDGKLRALSNNCRHRGTPLLDPGFGKIGKLIVCPYHAWSYDTEGSLKGVPFAKTDNLNKSDHCLPQFLCDSFMGLVFVNFSESAPPLEDRFAGLRPYLNIFDSERFDQASPDSTERWQANWKLAIENAMESYHLFKVHKETLETVTPSKKSYYIEGSSEWVATGGEMEVQTSLLQKLFTGSHLDIYNHYLLISLPPNFVGIVSYDSFGWLSVLPDGPNHSQIRAGALFESSSSEEDASSRAFTEAFFAEDKWICERVQQGMYSQKGSGGQLVEMERVVVDFHQYLASRLFSFPPTETFVSPIQNLFQESV